MTKRLLLFIILFYNYNISIYAQSGSTSPDPTLLPGKGMQGSDGGKNYSVDLFTGIGNIHIPIYEYSVDGVNLGVSLDYNTKGILVDQIASSVGLGFTLNAAPYIVRVPNDIEDEISTLKATVYPTQYRGLWIDSLNSNWNPDANHKYETEYDLFTAVLGGRSIDFIVYKSYLYNSSTSSWTTTYNTVTNPKSEVTIYATESGNPWGGIDTLVNRDSTHQLTFTIIDEKGNRFQFVQGDYIGKIYTPHDSVKYSWNYNATQRWIATSVTTVSGAVTTYSYKPYWVSYKYINNEGTTETGHILDAIFSTPVQLSGYQFHITQINYPNGDTVAFNLNDTTGYQRLDLLNTDMLHSISIKKGYDNNVRDSISYQFNYAYFNSPFSTSFKLFTQQEVPFYGASNLAYMDSLEATGLSVAQAIDILTSVLRLKLKSIYKIGVDGKTNELYYQFNYNKKSLPKRLNQSQDWYGYYNGATVNPTNFGPYIETDPYTGKTFIAGFEKTVYLGVPLHWIDYGNPYWKYTIGVDKTPVDSFMQADMLMSFVNGTGGTTTFMYGPPNPISLPKYNTFSTYSDTDVAHTYDGLVVQRITYFDGYNHDNDQFTDYVYSNGNTLYPGLYLHYPVIMGSSFNNSDTYVYSNKIVSPIDMFRGANHGYSTVQVKKKGTGFNPEILSYKIYNFTNVDDTATSSSNLNDDKSYPYEDVLPRTSMKKYKIGLLTSVSQYSGDFHLMSTTKYTYDTSYGVFCPNSTKQFFCKYLTSGGSTRDTTIIRAYHPFETAQARMRRVDVTSYSGSSSSSSTVYYNYDNNDNIASTQWTDSRGRTFFKKCLYNYNYDPAVYPTMFNATALHFANQNKVTEELQDISDTSNPKIVSFTQFSPDYSSSGYYIIDSIARSTLDTPVLLSAFHNLDTNNFNYNKYVSNITRFTARDNHNNIVESWNNQIYSSTIWDTRINKKLAIVSNAQYRDIAYTSFEGPVAALGTADYNKGNWDYNPIYVFVGTSSGKTMTGRYAYSLDPFHSDNIIVSQNNLTTGKKYILSFWGKDNIPRVYQGVSPTWTAISLTQQIQIGDWKLYTAIITGSGSSITITGNSSAPSGSPYNSVIDELRLYPVGASMMTYCYEPLLGVISQCNASNNISYYEYDAMGRTTVTRDINGNIISLTKQVNQGSDN